MCGEVLMVCRLIVTLVLFRDNDRAVVAMIYSECLRPKVSVKLSDTSSMWKANDLLVQEARMLYVKCISVCGPVGSIEVC